VADGVDRVVQRACREFGAARERLGESARERAEIGQRAMHAGARARRRMHTRCERDEPVQLVMLGRGEPDETRAVAQRVKQQP
jgi:hypothetical protein